MKNGDPGGDETDECGESCGEEGKNGAGAIVPAGTDERDTFVPTYFSGSALDMKEDSQDALAHTHGSGGTNGKPPRCTSLQLDAVPLARRKRTGLVMARSVATRQSKAGRRRFSQSS